jgi:Zn-dependent protease
MLTAGVIFMALTLYALRGGLVARNGLTVVGFETESLAMGVLAVIAAGYFFGPMYGIALILCIMIHEFGHVAAFRVAGHDDARFRLVPLMGGYAISNTLPATQKKDFFISLMGPGISVAPMVFAFGAADFAATFSPDAAAFLWTFASVTAAINFLNLLPFWPLDGGRCLRIIAYSFWPGLATWLTIGMSAAFAAAAMFTQNLVLFFFALMGAQSLMHADALSRVQERMGWRDGLLAAAAYLFTAAAHLWGGWVLIGRYM